jgi:hypothetical protein
VQEGLPPAPEGNLGLTSTAAELDEGTRGFVKVTVTSKLYDENNPEIKNIEAQY